MAKLTERKYDELGNATENIKDVPDRLLKGILMSSDIQPEVESHESGFEDELLALSNFRYFESLKDSKDYLVKDFIGLGEVGMIFAPPESFKSIITQHLAIAITSGKTFLGMRTKKHAVLVSDKENRDLLIRKRWIKIRRGQGVRKKDNGLFYLQRRDRDIGDPGFVNKLKNTIKKNNIKLLILDTLHRHSDYDENSSNEVNKLYMNVFSPIANELNCTIIFLHHTTKSKEPKKTSFRGSSDLLGMCDFVYKITKNEKENSFVISNDKLRDGEKKDICGVVTFDKDHNLITISRTNGAIPLAKSFSLRSKLSEEIKSVFASGDKLKTAQIYERIRQRTNLIFSENTLKLSLRFLVDNGVLIRLPNRQGYTLNNA